MANLLLGIILVASLAFLAFLVTVTIISVAHRKPGQSFAEAGSATISSGWRSLKSRFVSKSGYDFPIGEPFEEMKQPRPSAKYYHTDPAPSALNEVMSSYGRQAAPIVFPSAASAPLPSSDLNVPASGAYDSLANDALQEDLDAMSGRHLFGERQLPAAPITDDQFRYTGDFEIKQGDPLLNSALVKTDIGISNRGIGLWSAQ
jgi:hypothetical protein